MGYDLTFHLIDEKLIHDVFVPKLLGKSGVQTNFDVKDAQASEAWAIVRKSLLEKNIEQAAKDVCELAIRFSAYYLPHVYQRGFGLSVWRWDDAESKVAPYTHYFSPEPIFEDLIKAYPALKGKFPDSLEGNYMPGVFIPAGKVGEVIRWIDEQMEPLSKGDQKRMKPIRKLLAQAHEKGYAYWEASDFAVPMTGETPGDPSLLLESKLFPARSQDHQSVTKEQNPITAILGTVMRTFMGKPQETPITVERVAWPCQFAVPDVSVGQREFRGRRCKIAS